MTSLTSKQVAAAKAIAYLVHKLDEAPVYSQFFHSLLRKEQLTPGEATAARSLALFAVTSFALTKKQLTLCERFLDSTFSIETMSQSRAKTIIHILCKHDPNTAAFSTLRDEIILVDEIGPEAMSTITAMAQMCSGVHGDQMTDKQLFVCNNFVDCS